MHRRYLLCIVAPEPLAAQVEELGALLKPLTAYPRRTTAPVHITLLLADLAEELAPDLEGAIERGLAQARPFELRFEGIAHFSDQRTIYADPVDKSAISTMLISLSKAVAQVPEFVGQPVKITDSPHMTIASNLKPPQFREAWSLLGERPFAASFTVRDVRLMERPLSQGAAYSTIRTFALMA